MKTTLKVIINIWYYSMLFMSNILSIVLFIFEITVAFTYNQAQKRKGKMLLKANKWINKLKD